ncbi:hypothetical protein BU15DRAFT_66865 [Melanogaster broomeanus]|nr:hypothetical protein BU15DRAFT_66865 [Melanogaster broomeanus]
MAPAGASAVTTPKKMGLERNVDDDSGLICQPALDEDSLEKMNESFGSSPSQCGGNPNYTQYLLELYCNFKWEFPSALKTAILTIGSSTSMESLQFLVRREAQHKGQEFDEPFYRRVLAPNVKGVACKMDKENNRELLFYESRLDRRQKI